MLGISAAAMAVLIDAALKGTVVLAVAGAITILLRPASASVRHLVWTLAVTAVLVTPALSLLLPRWEIEGLPRFMPSAPTQADVKPSEVVVPIAPRLPASSESALSESWAPALAPAVSISTGAEGVSVSVTAPKLALSTGSGASATSRATSRLTVTEIPAAVVPRADAVPAISTLGGSAWQMWMVIGWLAGALLVATAIALGILRTWYLGMRARVVSEGRLEILMAELTADLELARHVTLLQSSGPAMPMTWGLFRPKVLVPFDADEWEDSRLRAVLLHELAHVKRLDFLTQLIARFSCAIYWFNPLVWVAAARLRVERELACDDEVLRSGSRASDYAGHLLDIARSLRAGPLTSMASVAMARPSQLSGRLLAVLDPRRARTVLTPKLVILALALTTLLVLPIAAATPGSTAVELEEPATVSASGVDVISVSVAAVGVVAEASASPEIVGEVVLSSAERQPVSWAPRVDEPAESVGRAIRDAVMATMDLAASPSYYVLDCDWYARGGRHSTSINVNDDNLRIKMSRDDCRLEIKARGELVFNDEETDIVSIERGGYFRMEEEEGRDSRRLEIEAKRDGSLEREFSVNGTVSAYDAEAQAWLADLLPVLFRRAGLQAKERAERILARDGVEGLLQEIAQIPSDHTARQYYTVLLSQAELEPDQVRQIVRQASREISSDYELAQLLIEIAENQPVNETVQIAYVEAARSISSDYEHRRVLSSILKREGLSVEAATALLQSVTQISSDYELAQLLIEIIETHAFDETMTAEFFQAVNTINSDYEQRRVLEAVFAKGVPSRQYLDLALESAARIASDYELAQLLIKVADVYPVEQQIPESYLAAARTIASDFELRRVLAKLLDRGDLSPSAVADVLESAQAISSDYELSQTLQLTIRKYSLDDTIRPAYFSAAGTISSDFEHAKVLKVALETEPLSEAVVVDVLTSSLKISSDYEMSTLLIAVSESYEINDRLQPAFMRAADTISSQHDRGRVLSALMPRGVSNQ